MSSRKKQSSNLIIQFLCMLFFFLFIYMIVSMFTGRTMPCGCGTGCGGRNVSCPCYRNRVLSNRNMNEYYTPQLNTSYTQYLDQVRENQLKFSREGFKQGSYIPQRPRPTLTQKNIPIQLNSLRSKGGIASLMK
jgi:hypothetical protein